MRSLMIAAFAALAFATAASAANPCGPSAPNCNVHKHTKPWLDAQGVCHAPDGKLAPASMCQPHRRQCQDSNGKPAKCGTPGAMPG